jgi:hypothetical protein
MYFSVIAIIHLPMLHIQLIFMNNNTVGASDLQLQIIKLEAGCIGISSVGRDYIISAIGSTVQMGMLRKRLTVLSQYFTNVFEQIK